MSLYDDLGVSKDATEKQIKNAYRKAAQKHHPDRPGGDQDIFHKIQKAYDVLGSPDSREHYDKTGKTEKPSTEREAYQRAASLFAFLIDDGSIEINFVNEAKDFIKKEIANIKKEIVKTKHNLKKYERLAGRVKSSSDNIFQSVIDSKISETKLALETLNREIEIDNIVLNLVLEHVDEFNPVIVDTFRSPFGIINFGAVP